jgi:hypothetical protein
MTETKPGVFIHEAARDARDGKAALPKGPGAPMPRHPTRPPKLDRRGLNIHQTPRRHGPVSRRRGRR